MEQLDTLLLLVLASLFGLFPVLAWLFRPYAAFTFEVYVAATVWALYFPALFIEATSGLWRFSVQRTEYIALFVFGCNACWMIGSVLLPIIMKRGTRPPAPPPSADDQDLRTCRRAIMGLLALGFLGFVMQVYALPGGLEATSLSRVEVLGSKHAMLQLIGTYLFICTHLALVAVGLLRKRMGSLYWISVVIAGLMCVGLHLVYRSRTQLLAFIVLLAIPYIQTHCTTRLRKLTICLALGAALFWFAATAQVARGSIQSGRDAFAGAVTRLSAEELIDHSLRKSDLGNVRYFYDALECFPHGHPFLWGSSYYAWILMPIPRSWISFKPSDTQVLFCQEVDPAMAQYGGTIPPTIYGDAYINFGSLGVLVFLFWGMLARSWSRFGDSHDPKTWASLAALAVAGPHFARGGFSNAMCLSLAAFVLAWVLHTLARPSLRAQLMSAAAGGRPVSPLPPVRGG